MSTLGFDPRPYCERLAKACPERFKVFERFGWRLREKTDGMAEHDWNSDTAFQSDVLLSYIPPGVLPHGRYPSAAQLWAFFGPLADECGIRPSDLVAYEGGSRSLLESIIAAVVEWFESQNESQNKSEAKR